MTDSRLAKLKRLELITFESIDAAPSDRRAPLIAQMRGILAEIENLDADASKGGDSIDEIAARRAARGGATSRLGHA